MSKMDNKHVMQAISRNDRDETKWSEWLSEQTPDMLCDLLMDLGTAEATFNEHTTDPMMKDIGFVAMHPMSVAAYRFALGVALHRLRKELISRVTPPSAEGSA